MTEKEIRTMNFIFHTKHSEYNSNHKSIFQTKPFATVYKEFLNNCKNDNIKQQLNSIDLMMATLFSLPIQLIQLRLDDTIKEELVTNTDAVVKIIWNGIYN